MKPLEELINRDKAELLHALFPAEIPAFIQFVKGMGMTIDEEQETIKAKWNNILSFEQWLGLARDANKKIAQYGAKLEQSKRLFADQLFADYMGVYMVHCLLLYIKQQVHSNEKFTMMVSVLFN